MRDESLYEEGVIFNKLMLLVLGVLVSGFLIVANVTIRNGITHLLYPTTYKIASPIPSPQPGVEVGVGGGPSGP